MTKEEMRLKGEEFIIELLTVFNKFEMELAHHHIEYDEYDSDDYYTIVPRGHGDRFQISGACIDHRVRWPRKG